MATRPSHIGRYRLGSVLGQGGMGRVYEATLEGPGGFEKKVALKVLKRQAARSEVAREALFREARLGALLRHPNLVDIYELGEADDHVFIAMELVDGPTVSDLLKKELLPAKAAVEIARQACTGLAHAHELEVRGEAVPVVHRDIKPSNILVDRTGLVKIADLGIASLAGPSQRVEGTRGFMSPEQCAGEPLDARSDIFSMGILLWSMVLGNSPLRADSLPATFVNTLGVEKLLADRATMAELAEVDLRLPPIVQRCLRRDPADRYPNMRKLARDLRSILRDVRGDSLLDVITEEDVDDADSIVWVVLPAPDTVSLARDPEPQLQPIQPPDTPFVGRDKPAKVLQALVLGGSAPVVTVAGPAGVGKSRLVQHVLRDTPMVAYADLFGLRDERGLLEAIARSLGIPVGADDLEGLAALLISSLRRRSGLRVVFDNADGVAAPLTAFLDRVPPGGARFVVAAREQLGATGEARLSLKPMRTENARAMFEALAGRGPDDDAEEKALSLLLHRLRGMPLAIELAAAKARSQTMVSLLAELDERFRLLEHASKSRQSTVQDTVRWSWELLGEAEQTALAQLTVFEGSFSVEAADAIIDTSHLTDAPWALDLLTALAHHSLVQTITTAQGPRFRLYPAVRSFAGERRSDEAGARHRHARWFARWGATARRALLFTTEGARHLRAVSEALPDLRAACLWSGANRRPDLAGATFLAASDLIAVRGPIRTGFELAEATQALRGLGTWRAEVLVSVALLYAQTGDPDAALKKLSDAIRIARRTEDPLREGHARAHRATVYQRLGKAEAALRDATMATELLEGRDLRLHGVALANLGLVHRLQGALEPAKDALRRSLATLEAAGDVADVAIALGTIGNVYREEGRYGPAEETLRQSIGLHRKVGNLRSECVTLGNLGALLVQLDRLDEAETALRSALDLAHTLGYSSAEAVFSSRLGDVLARMGRAAEATATLAQARASLEATGDARGQVECLVATSRLQVAEGQLSEAAQALEEAWKLLPSDAPLEAKAPVAIALARLDRGGRHVDRVLQRVMSVRRLAQQAADTVRHGELLVEEASLLARQGNRRTAAATLRMALSLFADIDAPPELADRVAEVRTQLAR